MDHFVRVVLTLEVCFAELLSLLEGCSIQVNVGQ